MFIYIIFFVFIFLILIIYIINGKKKDLRGKEQKIIKELSESKEEEKRNLQELDKKRKEDRKRKLEEEKRSTEQWKCENIRKYKEPFESNINDLTSKSISNTGVDPAQSEINQYYYEKIRILNRYINFEKENLSEINSNIRYYNSLINSISKIELDLRANDYELLFRNYLDNLRLNTSNSLFRSSAIYNIKYFYLFDYLSNYTFNTLQNNIEAYSEIRNLIYNFKKGIFNDNLPIILSYCILNEIFDIYNNEKYYICIIPASNIDSNFIRFDKLLQKISSELGINNGFDLVRRNYSINSSLQNGVKNTINVLEGISFSDELIGKNVILLDDVITKGNSLYNFNKKLFELGVNKVHPFFIGRTYYPVNKVLDSMDYDYNFNNLSFLNQDLYEINDIFKIKKG